MILPGDVRVFNVVPNWSDRYVVSLEYKTDIVTSRSGKEQRSAQRITPRRRLQYRATLTGTAARDFDTVAMGWLSRRFLIPDHPMGVLGLSAMLHSAHAMLVDSVPPWLVSGARVVLTKGDLVEARTVSFVTGSTVTFVETGVADWPVGAMISPARLARLAFGTTTSRLAAAVQSVNVSFDVEPGWDDAVTPPPPSMTHQGLEVLTLRPNWASAPSVAFTTEIDLLDFGRGVTDYYDPIPFRRREVKATYLRRDRSDIQQLTDFFTRAKGRRGSFYMPTWTRDMELAEQPTPLTLTVVGTKIVQYLATDTAHRDIAVILVDGSILTRRLNVVQAFGDYTRLHVHQPLPAGLTADDIAIICWLPRWRLGSDALSLSYVTSTVAECQLSFTSLESDLAPSDEDDGVSILDIEGLALLDPEGRAILSP